MAQDVTVAGASYSDVPAVVLPKSGGGEATFYDLSELTYVESINGQSGVVTLTIPPTMTVLSYGSSTWQNFIDAYNSNTIVYCRASSNSNPATGNQTRMAFMAYVNSTPPTNVEFQYYRSVSSHSATQQGDQVYIYKLDKNSGWSVTVREAMSKIAAGTNMSLSYSSGTITLNASSQLPSVSSSDNGKVLRVVNGAWAAESLPSASGVTF